MIRTIDEILEKSEENRITRELDECCTELLQLNVRKVEELSPEELEKRLKEWGAMLEKAKGWETFDPMRDEIYIPPSKFKFEYMPPEKLLESIQSSQKKSSF